MLAPRARRRGLRLRLRYEYLQPEVDDDPEPWELDDEDLAAIEEELRAAVERMWTNDDWRGVADDRRVLALPRTARSVATAPRPASRRGRCSAPTPTMPTSRRLDR